MNPFLPALQSVLQLQKALQKPNHAPLAPLTIAPLQLPDDKPVDIFERVKTAFIQRARKPESWSLKCTADRKQMAEDYRRDYNMARVIHKYGTSYGSLQRILAQFGIQQRGPARKPSQPEKEAALTEYFNDPDPNPRKDARIAFKYDLHYTSFLTWIRQNRGNKAAFKRSGPLRKRLAANAFARPEPHPMKARRRKQVIPQKAPLD